MGKRLDRLIVDFSQEPVVIIAKRRGARGGWIIQGQVSVPLADLRTFLNAPAQQKSLLMPPPKANAN